jgi:ATP-dependent Clp protease ATP-binding subunit ClpA
MFERYTDPAKRAIFFARSMAILNEAPAIDSQHLLCGLMWGEDSRAEAIFRLRQYFPLYTGCPWKIAGLPTGHLGRKEPPLDNPSKRVLAWTAREAARLGDYWIDTEHLFLGILSEASCLAASYLAEAGFTLASSRKAVESNKHSRPNYGRVPQSWRIRKLLERWW